MRISLFHPTVISVALLSSSLFQRDSALAAGCSAINFGSAGTFSAGTSPNSVAIGDFNGDGKLDLALANGLSANVSVLLGNGNGTFLAAVNYSAGSSPAAVAAGDFNLDGKLDLAVADASSSAVLVLLGNGNGTFQAAVSHSAGNNPRSVAVGDFNGDAKPDLAVANRGSADVSVLLGSGNGNFQAATNYAVGVDPLGMAVGDFNGDGKRDLTVANAALFSDPPSVSVLVAKSNGPFSSAVNYVVGTSPRSIAVGDFNGNGKLAMAVANYGAFVNGNFTNSSVSVLLGNGDGAFQAAVSYSAESGPIAVAAADFNNDGKLDLAVANNQSASVSVLLGNGNGTFQSAVNFAAGNKPVSVAVGDFNGDGAADLAVVNDAGILVLLNTGIDNTPPVITCPTAITLNAEAGVCTSNVTFTVTATDNCEVTSLVSSPASGFAFPVGVTTVTSTARDSSGNSGTCTFTVTVVASTMDITDQPLDVVACNGGTATFTASAKGTQPIAVQWQANTGTGHTNIPNATATTLTVPANASTVGSYRAVFSNPCGTNTSASANLALGTSLSCNISGPGFLCPNSDATLYNAPGFAAYQWSISGSGSLIGSTNNSSVMVRPGSSGTLTLNLRVADSTGCFGNCAKMVTVQDTTPPVISCPTNLSASLAPGTCTTNLTFSVTATDNCAVTNLTSAPFSGFAFPVGTTTVTNTARDSSGNASTCTFTVTVRDTQSPMINCPANTTVDALPGACASNVTFSVTATDNCAVASVTSAPPSGSAFHVGTTTVISTAQDNNGNASQCIFTVTVNDTQPPMITCPGNLTVNAVPGTCSSNVTFTVTATDNCGAPNVVSVPASGFAFPVGTTTVTNQANDASGNTAQCTFTVTVNDTQLPAIACPANLTVNTAPGACTSNVTFVVTASDNCTVTNLSSVPASGFSFPRGTTTVTNVARDSRGNSSTCTFTVTVNDTQPPTITCPANQTVNAAPGGCTSNVTFIVTARDNCAVTNVSSVPASGFAFSKGTTTVTNTAQDISGNSSTCTFTVTVNDTQPPAITCPANLTVNAAPGVCTSNVTFTVTATDNCALTNLLSVPASGFGFPVGATVVTNTARDSSGNRSTCTFTVTVNDSQPPVITCPGNRTVNAAPGVCTSNVTFSVTATDNCAVTNVTSSPASGFAFPQGTTTVTSTARDSNGNSSTCTFAVTVNDTQPPQLTCPANRTVNAAPGVCSSNVTFLVTASDNCAVTNMTSSPASGFAFPLGTTMVTSTARDSSGNSSTCTFTVTVRDTLPPTITCPANLTVNTASGACASNVTFTVSAIDNCAVTNVTSSPASGFAFPRGITTVTTTARDSSGNSSTCTFTVTVNDTQPPAITCPANRIVNAAPGVCTSNVTFAVTATDNCAVTNISSVPASGFAFPQGTTTVTNTAWDSSGNISTCTFTVTVVDTQPPQMNCPANFTVSTVPGVCVSNVTFSVTATDNCTVTNVSSSPASGFAFPIGTTTVTSTATDSNGNASACTFTVTVVGTPMSITNQPANVTACTGGTATFTAAASGTLPIAVQWQANTGGGFTNIPNATTTTLTVPANASTVGSYRAVFTNPCGTNTTASATLTVGTSLSCNIDGPPGVCPNAVGSLFTAPGFHTYQWSISGNGSLVGAVNNASVQVNAGPAGSYTLTLQVTDTTGCLGNCSKVVPIQDLEAPVITCPTNRTVNAAPGVCTSNVTFSVTANDNCAVTNVTSSPASGFAFPLGVTTVTSTARDGSGNSSTCTFTVTVNDNRPPVLSGLPASTLTVQCLAHVPIAPTVTANDNCDALVTVTYTPSESGDPCNRIITRTWSAADASGNPVTFTQTITVHDDTNPTLTKGAIASSYATVAEAEAAALAATGASDNCSDAIKTVGTVGVCPGVITVTATDTCGNQASVTYNTCISTAAIDLAVTQSGTTVTISWPFPSTGLVLESAARLSVTSWQPATETQRTNNGRLEVTVPINQQERYFRLRKP